MEDTSVSNCSCATKCQILGLEDSKPPRKHRPPSKHRKKRSPLMDFAHLSGTYEERRKQLRRMRPHKAASGADHYMVRRKKERLRLERKREYVKGAKYRDSQRYREWKYWCKSHYGPDVVQIPYRVWWALKYAYDYSDLLPPNAGQLQIMRYDPEKPICVSNCYMGTLSWGKEVAVHFLIDAEEVLRELGMDEAGRSS